MRDPSVVTTLSSQCKSKAATTHPELPVKLEVVFVHISTVKLDQCPGKKKGACCNIMNKLCGE